ncbi:TolC family outer membrane protein [Acetobacteraceae bacterium ESL0709]|nr:TolC family outer membrane protein [Acetobacteraceae bacterium ESL0697]MDF7678139.1 TolC family outer membrane protein [Acetobacteraceae bacterium ESL0709]
MAQTYDGKGAPDFIPHTLRQAMATAYLTNPQLREARAQLRSVDEQLPAAQSGWRPTIQGTGGLTYYSGSNDSVSTQSYPDPTTGKINSIPFHSGQNYSAPGYTTGVTVTQPIYQGGRTMAATRQARNQIMAQRARLISTEQTVLLAVANAYISLVQDEQLLQISMNNERVLRQQLNATNKRFRLGELSRTDVAQAQGALATAEAQRQQAEGVVQQAQAAYVQAVGIPAPPSLQAPQALVLPVKNEKEVIYQAVHNNPDVIAALFDEAQHKDSVSVQMAAILPKISAELGYQKTHNQGSSHSNSENKYAELAFQIPLYQGGSEYAAVRQARQNAEAAHHEVNMQRRSALQKGSAGWQQMMASKESIESNKVAVSADIAALAGVERQAILGTSSTLEVLQQQQTLLLAQQTLIQSIASYVYNSYATAAAIGRLTAIDLKLNVPLYDEKAYFDAVKGRIWGTGDYAVNQPGR